MTKILIPVAGLGFELLRVWPDGESDTTVILAFVVDLSKEHLFPEPVTLTGESHKSAEFKGAIVLPDKTVTDGCGEYKDRESFITWCRQLRELSQA